MQAPHGGTILTAHRHYDELFAPTTAGACLRQRTQPRGPRRGQATKESDLRTACQSAIQHSTSTQSPPEERPPEQPSETYRTNVREFARYRASHDLPLLPN